MNWTAALGYSLLLYLLLVISGIPIGVVLGNITLTPETTPTWLIVYVYTTNFLIYLLFFAFIATKYPKHILRTNLTLGLIFTGLSQATDYIARNTMEHYSTFYFYNNLDNFIVMSATIILVSGARHFLA